MRNRWHRAPKLAGELLVPLMMVAFLAAYWWQAAGLSLQAISFPLALTGVLVLLLFAQLALVWRSIMGPTGGEPQGARSIRTRPSRDSLAAPAQRLALVAIAIGLFAFWRELGGTLVIFAFTAAALLVLGERRWPVLLLMPTGLTIVLSYLFKVVLQTRFPDGLLVLF